MRNRSEAPSFNQNTDTGRMGFRYPDEPEDERPLVVETAFDREYKREASGRVVEVRCDGRVSELTERLEYEHAVEANPRRNAEGLDAWLRRIVIAVEGRLSGAPVKGWDPEDDVRAIFGPVDSERVQAGRAVLGEREED